MNILRFLLNGKPVELDQVDPTLTVLQFLREQRLLVGTKEGCAEGDCGACTVVVAELADDGLQFRAVNACIQFLPTLDGKALFTVESLKSAAGVLHPVQQSLVDYHGSQCGFCTPGFVMSMFALYQTGTPPDRDQIDDALSGNLCRCTGYRPIIDACLHMHDYAAVEFDDRALINQLQGIRRSTGFRLKFGNHHYFAPASVDELAQAYVQSPQAQILAGGTDVGLWVTKQLRELATVIYLGNVQHLKQIRVDDRGIEVGAAASLDDAFAAIAGPYPEFAEMFRRFASMPVRNAGTLAGNVANGSPIGDSMPALIAVDARVRLRQGDRQRELPLESLYLDYMENALEPGEFVEAVLLPPRNPHISLRCYKVCKRYDQDISAVCAAFSILLRNDGMVSSIRIALGGMAAIPKRASLTEAFVVGKAWNESTVKQSMALLNDDFSPMSDMRASAGYRGGVAANLLYRFYLETAAEEALDSASVNVFEVVS